MEIRPWKSTLRINFSGVKRVIPHTPFLQTAEFPLLRKEAYNYPLNKEKIKDICIKVLNYFRPELQ